MATPTGRFFKSVSKKSLSSAEEVISETTQITKVEPEISAGTNVSRR
jgi:hypothetical protein